MHYYALMPPHPVPSLFCWSRFGTESGEPITKILERKEVERQATGGTFYWGIGNSVGPGMAELVQRCAEPEVLFSPIKSKPRLVDVAPALVVRWRAAKGLDGKVFELPEAICITSRATTIETLGAHYALICSSDDPLRISGSGRVSFSELRNLRSGSRLGASQVTAVVERVGDASPDELQGGYLVALRARLVAPHFVRLLEPEPLVPFSRSIEAA